MRSSVDYERFGDIEEVAGLSPAASTIMTYSRFSELWHAAFDGREPVKNPIAVDQMSDRTIDALVAAADGDHSVFDQIATRLAANPA